MGAARATNTRAAEMQRSFDRRSAFDCAQGRLSQARLALAQDDKVNIVPMQEGREWKEGKGIGYTFEPYFPNFQ